MRTALPSYWERSAEPPLRAPISTSRGAAAVAGERPGAGEDVGVRFGSLPRPPARLGRHRYEDQLGAGDLARRVFVQVDLEPVLAEPARAARSQIVQYGGPAALADPGGAGDDIGLEDVPSAGSRPPGRRRSRGV